MGKNKILIHFTDRVYFGGDVLLGVVELNLKSKIKSRGVRFMLSGHEEARWTVQHGNNGSTTYHEKWIFLQHRMDLAGAPRTERKKAPVEEVEAGVYHWPIAVRLPDFLPPTSNFAYGWTRYRLSAYVDIPMGFDITRKQDFIVGGLIYNPYLYITPAPMPEERKNKKCFFFAKGKMHMTSQIDRENYFVGDVVRIRLSVDNQSRKPVNNIKLTLMDNLSFYAVGRERHMNTTLHRQKYEHKIKPKSKSDFDLQFLIPDLLHTSMVPNTNHLGGRLVQVRFTLWVRLDIPWAVDLKCSHYISIMKRDPKAVGLPPPAGPLVVPTGNKWLVMPPMAPVEPVAVAPAPTFAQPVLYVPQVAGYNFPQDTAIIGLHAGEYKMEEDEAFLLD